MACWEAYLQYPTINFIKKCLLISERCSSNDNEGGVLHLSVFTASPPPSPFFEWTNQVFYSTELGRVSKNVFQYWEFGIFLKIICQEWMAVQFPWTRSTLMHCFVKFKMICRTSDPPKQNGRYDDELHIIWFSSNPKVNVFRSSGNVTVVRSKIHKMKGKHNIFKCSWDRNFGHGNDY